MIWSNARKITFRDVKTRLTGTNYETDTKRQIRKPLLDAYDIHKGNVNYGTVTESEEEHSKVVKWYKDILDLKDEAFEAIPAKVQRHAEVK